MSLGGFRECGGNGCDGNPGKQHQLTPDNVTVFIKAGYACDESSQETPTMLIQLFSVLTGSTKPAAASPKAVHMSLSGVKSMKGQDCLNALKNLNVKLPVSLPGDGAGVSCTVQYCPHP